MIATPGCPCKGCKNRSVNCHNNCKPYIEWSKKAKENNQKQRFQSWIDRLSR